MLVALVSCAVLSLSAGDVCPIPDGARLCEPGKINWALKDRTFAVPPGTRALVVRMNPEQTPGVAEVKVFDGTGRLGWLDATDLESVRSTLVIGTPDPRPGLASVAADKPYGVKVPRRRRGPAPDFSAVDAAIGAMGAQSMAVARQHAAVMSWRFNDPIGFANAQAGLGSAPVGVMGGVGIGGYPRAARQSHLCGAPTATTGAPCRNRVLNGVHCYLHGG